jgi:tetratricopeptide (TPR) repeat protein
MAIFTLSQTRLNHIGFISEKRGIYQRIISWESDSFPKTRWTPQRVRELVSQKFQKFHTKGRINPDLAVTYINRAFVYYNQQKWDLALSAYTKAITIDPDYAQAYYSRGLVYHQLGNINKARKNLLLAAKLYLDQGNNADYQQVIRILNSL